MSINQLPRQGCRCDQQTANCQTQTAEQKVEAFRRKAGKTLATYQSVYCYSALTTGSQRSAGPSNTTANNLQ